jgi:transposase-like protein
MRAGWRKVKHVATPQIRTVERVRRAAPESRLPDALTNRKRLRTANMVERLNEELRRRDRVIRIYPNPASAIRLMGAQLVEHDESW